MRWKLDLHELVCSNDDLVSPFSCRKEIWQRDYISCSSCDLHSWKNKQGKKQIQKCAIHKCQLQWSLPEYCHHAIWTCTLLPTGALNTFKNIYIFQMPNDYRSLLLGFNNTHNVLIVWKRLPVMWTPSLPHHRHSSADITGYRRQTNIRFFVVRMQRFLIIKFVIWQLDLYLGLLVHFFVSFFNHLFINIIPWRSRSTVLVLMLLLEGVWNLELFSQQRVGDFYNLRSSGCCCSTLR